MILELDIGNTRVKWRSRAADGAVAGRGACALEELLAVPPPGAQAGVAHIRAACVRGAGVERQLADWSGAHGVARLEFARVVDGAAGLRPAYTELATLGVDRWLAMLAAYGGTRDAVCVIQCGSAITVDLVDAHGRHHGGLIAPGLGLMRQSLLAGTDRVRFPPHAMDVLDLAPGRDTSACVRAGLSTAAIGLIERAVQQYRGICPGARALITGGDAARIAPLLGIATESCPELVLDGLAHAFG